MSIEVKVPQLPESVTDATLVAWHKQPGDTVSRDENLVDLETDKVVLEVPAPASGVLKEPKVENGATVTAGQVLAIREEGAAAAPSPSTGGPAEKAKPAAQPGPKCDGGGAAAGGAGPRRPRGGCGGCAEPIDWRTRREGQAGGTAGTEIERRRCGCQARAGGEAHDRGAQTRCRADRGQRARRACHERRRDS